jgi:hypothetical protein
MLAFIDETGDHSLSGVVPEYPIFALGALVISETQYQILNDRVEAIKTKYFSNPETFILHSSELKRPVHKYSDPRNAIMLDPTIRRSFYAELDEDILQKLDFSLIVCFLNKLQLLEQYAYPVDPYSFSFENLMNRILRTDTKATFQIYAEQRGPELDAALLEEHLLMTRQGTRFYNGEEVGRRSRLTLLNKKDNVNGLQVIDLVLSCLARDWLGKTSKMEGNDLTPALVKRKYACPPTYFPH